MKTHLKITGTVLLFLSSFFFVQDISCQTYISNTPELTTAQQKTIASDILNTPTEQQINTQENNVVFITQIGENNQLFSNTNASNSFITILQKGDLNNISLDISADTIKETIIQNGNNNSFLDYSNFNVKNHEINVLQNGNNQNLIWYGGNEISEKMKITMQGDSKTIIVRNFN